MSGLDSILGSALGGDMLAKIAGQLNTDEAGAKKAVGSALPALLGRMKSNADDPAQAEALAAAVNKDHDGSLLDGLSDKFGGLFGSDGDGSKIVGKVFGGDTDAVQEQVAAESGINKGQAAGLLGALAPILMGALGKSGQATGGLQANGLSGMLGGLMGGGGAGGGLGGMLGGLLGGGGGGGLGSMLSGAAGGGGASSGMMGKVTGMLDQNKDGSVIDDITRMASGGAGGGGAAKSGILGKLLGMFGKK